MWNSQIDIIISVIMKQHKIHISLIMKWLIIVASTYYSVYYMIYVVFEQ